MKFPKWLRPDQRSSYPDLHDILEDSRRYLKGQTFEPLKVAGLSLAFGLSGSLITGAGLVLALIGLLRILQSETGSTFSGVWTFAPYAFVATAGVLIVSASVLIAIRQYRKRVSI